MQLVELVNDALNYNHWLIVPWYEFKQALRLIADYGYNAGFVRTAAAYDYKTILKRELSAI